MKGLHQCAILRASFEVPMLQSVPKMLLRYDYVVSQLSKLTIILLYGLSNGAAGYHPEGRNYAKLLPNVGEDFTKVLAQVLLPGIQMMDMGISPMANARGLWFV